jgi:6-phosphogluconolactonase/glucosamine-6-phosphate isomerase/deaminase
MSRLRVFVSSTVKDLESERQIIEKVLQEMRIDSFLSEHKSAQHMAPRDTCLNTIFECDALILIIGGKYGYVPKADRIPGSPYDGKISVTHGEFLEARRLQKPILVFVKEITRETRERNFLTEVSDFLQGQFYTTFTNPKELYSRVAEAVSELVASLVRLKYVPLWKWQPSAIIVDSPEEVAKTTANILGLAIRSRPNANIGLSAGRTMANTYFQFFQNISVGQIANITQTNFFSVTEHFGISQTNPHSYSYWYNQAFFDKISEYWNLVIPDEHKKFVPSCIDKDSFEGFMNSYDEYLQINRVDVQFISPSPSGQIISIDPDIYPVNEMASMGTSLVRYGKETSRYLVPASPHDLDIIIGFRNLLNRSERLVIPVHGLQKREIVRRMILGPIGSDCPASLVAMFPKPRNLLFILDRDSCSGLPSKFDPFINLISPSEWHTFW